MDNEVRIKLTDEQKSRIKEATGKELPEIRVESFGDTPAVSHPEAGVSARTTARKAARLLSGKKAARAIHAKVAAKRATRAIRAKVAAKVAAKVSAKKAARAIRAKVAARKATRLSARTTARR